MGKFSDFDVETFEIHGDDMVIAKHQTVTIQGHKFTVKNGKPYVPVGSNLPACEINFPIFETQVWDPKASYYPSSIGLTTHKCDLPIIHSGDHKKLVPLSTGMVINLGEDGAWKLLDAGSFFSWVKVSEWHGSFADFTAAAHKAMTEVEKMGKAFKSSLASQDTESEFWDE